MDARRFMVIDTSRRGTPRMFITKQVGRIELKDGMWNVVFEGSVRSYTYRFERIRLLREPEIMDLDVRGFYLRNRRVDGLRELYRFKHEGEEYYHAVFEDGNEIDFDNRDVYLSRTTLDECGGDLWQYLNQLAEETGLETDDGGNILKKQYAAVDCTRDNVPLARYVGDRVKNRKYKMPSCVIYPFGCNASQKQGVEKALTNQVSIIQGPPGTGKTQTILNIVANLLVMGKSVLIVSNNNSAVENVAEKLSSPGIELGFLVAQLGNFDNRTRFIESQPELPDMSDWELSFVKETGESVKRLTETVSKGFDWQTRLASLKIEKAQLSTEIHYNNMQGNEVWCDAKWLDGKPSRMLLELKNACDSLTSAGKRPGIWFCIRWMLRMGMKAWPLLHLDSKRLADTLDAAYYATHMSEINAEIAECEEFLGGNNMERNMGMLRDLSLKLLKHKISLSRKGRGRKKFDVSDIYFRSEEFLHEYPVVLSTTYAAKSCIGRDMVFDYVIMDEASQVDIVTGALSLSCALNAVIVGDDKQLPNVIDGRMRQALETIERLHGVGEEYRSSANSFLESCCKVFDDAPQTLLREHYRCHPKIIEFCNRMFYDGQLLTMTRDSGEDDVLTAVRTVKGNHARGCYNQREIDVIKAEIMPKIEENSNVGIITPYREQASEINRQLGCDIASTVHKYQGRECDIIIMSMVDNSIRDFSDNPNLLNVAISRAKKGLHIVANGNEISPESNLGQLISYIRYQNYDVSESNLHSVFDFLYKQYTEERLALEDSTLNGSGELSEALIYKTMQNCLRKLELNNSNIVAHYPLSRLIADSTLMDDEERRYALNANTHVDFLIYNDLTKIPQMCVEVDGWQYHNSEVQQKRDRLKDRILAKYGLPILRLSTVDTVTEDILCNQILQCIDSGR